MLAGILFAALSVQGPPVYQVDPVLVAKLNALHMENRAAIEEMLRQ
jgi:hypothetical protein